MTLRTITRAGALLAAGLLSLAGCKGDSGDPGSSGSSCTVTQNGNGTATISCTDGTTATVSNGTDGSACTAVDNGDGTKTISCEDGTIVTVSDGRYDAETKIANFHGAPTLLSEGEYLPCPAGVTSGCGKEFVDAQITSATADAAGLLTVNFTVKDAAGAPYTKLTAVSADVVKLVPGSNGSASDWVAYIYRKQTVGAKGPNDDWPAAEGAEAWQPTSESSGTGAANGTLTNHGDGSYTYVFKKNLATAVGVDGTTLVGYDRSLTHRVSIMMGGHQGPTADANFDFRPDGAAMTERRDIVQTETCKNCHGWEFHGHGGNRLTMENCVTCHVANTFDPHGGESLDMKVMTHKIHAGRELPSVAAGGEYAIWGNSNTKHEWALEEFPAVLANCTACHTGTAAQADNWKMKPTREACGSCHDDVDFAAGTNHMVQANDANCAGCHPPSANTGTASDRLAIVNAHAWSEDASYKVDKRNFPEFGVELSVSAPANGTHFVAGEAPVVTLKLRDLEDGGAYIDHTTVVEDAANESCTATVCDVRDGAFRSAALMVHGPRGLRKPALTTAARAQILSSGTGPFNLSAAGATLVLKVDQGQDLFGVNATGGDFVMAGTITVPVSAAAFADVSAATTPEIVAWLNANAAFKLRAIAFEQDGRVGIRSRNLGKVYALQLQTSAVTTAVFGNDTGVKVPGANGSNNVAERTDSANDDPKAARTAEAITYTLDPVDDLAPGTYVVSVEMADRGRTSATVYRTPSVGWITFQVKQAAEELPPAGNCNLCHQNADGQGYVLDFGRHHKKFGFDAIDQCGPCHDYQPTSVTGTWTGGGVGHPISKRVHAVHNGSSLNYPLTTVAYANGDAVPGRNWRITYPQDVRNCETCHPAGVTSGSWMTKPARLPCMGCHDADSATAHMKLQTFDPTPADPFSGDEQESCVACH
jgi:OmcA/MtrC family decaheme c-type cytochrome